MLTLYKFPLSCLECNKSCSRGQLDTVLCQCKCPDGVIQGRVVTSSGAPLRDAGILSELFPYTEVARTNESGHFSIIDRCENSSYRVTKNDYIPFRLEDVNHRDDRPLLIHLEATGSFFQLLCKIQCKVLFKSFSRCMVHQSKRIPDIS